MAVFWCLVYLVMFWRYSGGILAVFWCSGVLVVFW